MNKRERTLVLLVGLSLFALAAFFGVRKVTDASRARRQQIAAAEKAVRDKTQLLRLSAEPADRMEDYQRRSLPSDLEKARSLYQTWLLNLVKDVGLEDTQVSVLPARSEKGVYHVLGFSVSGRGNLPKLVSFLHRFYSADLLHRVRRLHAKRVPGTKQLDLAVAIDAVSLPTADSTDKLNEQAARKLAYGDLTAYLSTILQRNLSGPANKEPSIELPTELTKYVGDLVAFAVKGQDPDKLDQIQLRHRRQRAGECQDRRQERCLRMAGREDRRIRNRRSRHGRRLSTENRSADRQDPDCRKTARIGSAAGGRSQAEFRSGQIRFCDCDYRGRRQTPGLDQPSRGGQAAEIVRGRRIPDRSGDCEDLTDCREDGRTGRRRLGKTAAGDPGPEPG